MTSEASPESYARTVATLADEYLADVLDCVRALDRGLRAALDGGDAAAAAAGVAARETDCDESLRAVREAVAEMPPTFTTLYLRPGEAVTFFDRVDVIANRAEATLRDLRIVDPPLDAVAAELRSMAGTVVEMVEILVDAAGAHFDPRREPTDAVGEAADAVRDAERRCDDHRTAALERAFADGPSASALGVRTVVLSLDDVADAVEDAADHLAYVERGAA